jgi:cystathionine beta-lyase/cystathionine gamma-synthase
MVKKGKRLQDSTLCVHNPGEARKFLGAVNAPIFQSSTFAFKNTQEVIQFQKGRPGLYLYTRYANPTVRAAEELLAPLEGGEDCVVTASGLAAITSILLSRLKSGEEFISNDCIYGGTYHLFNEVFTRFGIRVRYVPSTRVEVWSRAVTSKTRALFIESPTNPNLQVIDVEAAVGFARHHRLYSIFDNTFATPVNQKPLSFGVDAVIHSGSKYLAGHSDLICGAVIGRKKDIDQARRMMLCLGSCIDPQAAYLLLRGLRTLPLRVRKHNENAARLADFLSTHRKVKRVFYPGLESHPQHDLAKEQMVGFGGMICFEVVGGVKAATKVIDSLRIPVNATSLGGVESLASLPVYTSHYGFSKKELERAGVTGGMIRLSVGIEDPKDLIADLKQALGKI